MSAVDLVIVVGLIEKMHGQARSIRVLANPEHLPRFGMMPAQTAVL
jgi:hypothetical protein